MGQYPRPPRDSSANCSPSAARYPHGSGLKAALATPNPAQDRVSTRLKHRRRTRIALRARRTRIALRMRLLWLLVSVVGLSAVTIGGLIALAPTLTEHGESWQGQGRPRQDPGVAEPLRVALDGEHFYQLDLDPRQVEFDLLRGWDREQEAFADPDALAFFSGPMYERYYRPDPRLERIIDQTVQPSSPKRAEDQGYTVPLGDLKFGPEIWRGLNRAAAGQRAFIGIDHAGVATFGYGELTAERARTYETFIGGLHVLYNDLQPEQPGYRGAYSKGVGQKIRYYLPRVRVVIGLRPDRRLDVLMSKDGLTLEETRELSRKRGLVAAYLPDHASKSRFIVPSIKGFSEEDANWISGGSVSYVHVPYMIRISRRRQPAEPEPDPIIPLPQAPADTGCRGPLSCAREGLLWAGDRSLSGLNRLMGVVLGGRSLPEPPITADPPVTQWQFPPRTPTAALPEDGPNPTPQPWESAWMPDDMTQPILVPQDAGEDFWEQTFPPLPPSLPALDPAQEVVEPRLPPLPTLQPTPPAPVAHQGLPEFPVIHATQQSSRLEEPVPPQPEGRALASEPQLPPPPALDPGLDSMPVLPRLDPAPPP
ncbi:MAG: hypothetical protein OXF25_10970 [Cyanobacteria bacterium MAG CAR3_bin_5]|nr:hypothetical protein [Cyanobacteria bacterium MAG CAR3_bin_5]